MNGIFGASRPQPNTRRKTKAATRDSKAPHLSVCVCLAKPLDAVAKPTTTPKDNHSNTAVPRQLNNNNNNINNNIAIVVTLLCTLKQVGRSYAARRRARLFNSPRQQQRKRKRRWANSPPKISSHLTDPTHSLWQTQTQRRLSGKGLS